MNNLKDPAWWFTAVLIAVLASTSASFLKDYLEGKFNFFLSWSVKKREQARINKQEIINAWSSSETLLIIAILYGVYSFLIFVAVFIFITICLSSLDVKYKLTHEAIRVKHIIGLALALICLSWTVWTTARMFICVGACIKKFCQSRGLPKLWDIF
jgi:hypothetical protein